jgi:L-alanine-DL-glutamate epimerase-like enolase superfamily enzyme
VVWKFRVISKIEVQRYTLKPRLSGATPRAGALLRVSYTDLATTGLSDLFPWREYGDPGLESWFEELRTPKPTSFTVLRALEAARDEALAVSEARPLVRGSIVNHALATDPVDLSVHDVMEARRSTCPALKIKIGRHDPLEEASALSRLSSHWGLRLRLDANERLTREGLLKFLEALPIRIRETLEFIEDPFAFDLTTWAAFHRETGILLAYDRGTRDRGMDDLAEIFDEGAAQVLIHKPAWQDDARARFAREQGKPVVITSILGHPIGNLWAAARAFELAPDGVHGCLSHVAYRDDEATKVLLKSKQVRGSRVVGIGHGVGLQSPWMRRLRWETLLNRHPVEVGS